MLTQIIKLSPYMDDQTNKTWMMVMIITNSWGNNGELQDNSTFEMVSQTYVATENIVHQKIHPRQRKGKLNYIHHIWVNYYNSLTWSLWPQKGMISLIISPSSIVRSLVEVVMKFTQIIFHHHFPTTCELKPGNVSILKWKYCTIY